MNTFKLLALAAFTKATEVITSPNPVAAEMPPIGFSPTPSAKASTLSLPSTTDPVYAFMVCSFAVILFSMVAYLLKITANRSCYPAYCPRIACLFGPQNGDATAIELYSYNPRMPDYSNVGAAADQLAPLLNESANT